MIELLRQRLSRLTRADIQRFSEAIWRRYVEREA